jgi:virginiamycin B lyase
MEDDMKRVLLAASAALAISAPAFAYETKVLPLPNQTYIHDVAPGQAGQVFWTAQSDGLLGVLDPKTGANKFIKLGAARRHHRQGRQGVDLRRRPERNRQL